MRSHQHHHVGKTVDHQAEIGLWPALPFIFEADAAGAAEIDIVEGTGDGIESGREDDDVELVRPGSGPDAVRRDPLDRRLAKVDQFDIVLVVDLIIEGLERQPSGAKAVIPGDQLFRDLGVLDALANFPCDEIADRCVGLAVDQDVAEITLPDPEAAFAIELFVEGLALLVRNLECATRIGCVNEAGEGFLAPGEHLGISRLDSLLCLGIDLAVVQRRAPVGRALEHGEMSDLFRNGLDGLHAGCAGANHRDALACKIHRLLRPARGVKGFSLKTVATLDPRQRGRRQRADRSDQETRGEATSVLKHDAPATRFLFIASGRHPAPELDVAPQVEFVGDVIEIAQRFRLAGEMLGPLPFLQQVL